MLLTFCVCIGVILGKSANLLHDGMTLVPSPIMEDNCDL